MKKRMLMGVTVAAVILMSVILPGCTENAQDNTSDSGTEQSEGEVEVVYDTIRFTDGFEGIYEEALDIRVDATDAPELLKELDASERAERQTGGLPWYAVEFLDASGQPLRSFTVYTDRVVCTDEDIFYQRSGSLDQSLTTLEQAHGLDYSLVERKPGKNYFMLADLAGSGNLFEFTENNFVEGLDVDLSGEQLTKLGTLLMSYDGGFEPDDTIETWDTAKYRLSLFTQEGSELYVLDIMEDSSVFVGYWRMESPGLTDFVKEIVGKSSVSAD